jgi:hypothetical protein
MTNQGQKLTQTVLLYSLLLYGVGFVIFFALSTFLQLPYSLGNGWVLGGSLSVLNYLIIMFQAKRLQMRVEANIKTPYISQGYSFLRLAISAVGLLASVFVKLNDVEVFNLFTVFAAYLVISGVIFLTGAQFKIANPKP